MIIKKSYNVKLCLRDQKCYNALLFDFQEYIIAETEIKMLVLETLFMLVNTVLYEYDTKCFKKWAKPFLFHKNGQILRPK